MRRGLPVPIDNTTVLAVGTNNVTAYTVPANRTSVPRSILVTYAGTTATVTVQLLIGTIPVGVPVGTLTSGAAIRLWPLDSAQETPMALGDALIVVVTNATVADTLRVQGVTEECLP